MSENDVSVWFHFYGIDEEREKLEALDKKRDEVVTRWKTEQQVIVHDLSMVRSVTNAAVGLLRNALGVAGVTVDAIGNAVIQIVQVSVESMFRVAVAWGSTGYGLPMAIALSAAAIGLSTWSLIDVTTQKDSIRGQINSAVAATENLYSMMRSLGRW